jgi:phage tail-like protein
MSTPFFAPGQQSAMLQPGGMPPSGGMPQPGGMPQSSLASAVGAAIQSLPLRRLGLAMRFQVVVAGVAGMSLGHWTSCEGLKVEFKYDSIREGGDCTSTHVLPKTVDYTTITLKRAVEFPYSGIVQQWLSSVADAWQAGDVSLIGAPIIITLLDAFQVPTNPAAEWILANAFPVQWIGPSMGAKSSDVATETLVLQHDGFLGTDALSSAGIGAASTLGAVL